MTENTPQEPVATADGGSKKKVVAGGAGVALLAAVVGGGAYAYNQLSGGGAQPSDVLPSTMQVYARLDLDPGASQKIELFKLLKKVPEVGDALGIEDPNKSDVRRIIFEEIAADACPDLDYGKDVEPWLGDRVGVGANIDDEQFVVAVQVKDEKKAEAGIKQLFECGDESFGIAHHEGYALLSDTQKTVDDALDAAKKKSLSDQESFAEAMDALGEKGVASAWLDAEGLVEVFGDDLADLSEEQRQQIQEAGSVAVALRVDGSAIELAGVSDSVEQLDGPTSPISQLPEDTVAAVSLSGLGEAITEQWDLVLSTIDEEVAGGDDAFLEGMSEEERQLYEEFTSAGPLFDPGDFIAELESSTGLKLPDDLANLLGQTFTLSIGGANLEQLPTLGGPADIEKLQIAIRTTDGKGSAIDVLGKLADLASDLGVPLVAEEIEGGAVLATSSDAVKAVSGKGDLGGSDAFKAVMPFGDDTTQGFFLDVNAIIEKLMKADPPKDIRQFFEDARFVDAIGISAGNVDDHAHFSLRVSFTD